MLIIHYVKIKHFVTLSTPLFQYNIGVMDENPSTVPGVIGILDRLHKYVPMLDGRVHTLITWGDGLSCERHVDAQNARANEPTPRDRLEGPQDFHKRILLLQVSYVVSLKYGYVLNFKRTN